MCRRKSQFTIIRILQEEVAKNPRDARSWFYLGRTHASVGNRTAALHAYERLSAVAEWDEGTTSKWVTLNSNLPQNRNIWSKDQVLRYRF